MCHKQPHRHSIFCVVPPHILHQIAQNGTEEERTAALHTLEMGNTFRTLRAIRLAAPAAPAAAATVTLQGQKQRTIFDAHHTQTIGDAVRSEGAPASGDPAVNEAYDGLGDTYDFYWNTLQRNSIDGQGMPLNATVHYDQNLDNAFWDGQRMNFGDGDNRFFKGFTISIDIMGHELTHGVTEVEAQLIYQGQSGALNESVSDVFGSMVKQYAKGKQSAEEADWLIGEGIFTERVHGVALRSMKDPGSAFDDPGLGKDPQPSHMNNYVNTVRDNGGVHLNSGIPNRAFYLAATGIGGYAGEKAGPIWYATLRDARLHPNATFQQFAQLTSINAENLFPGGTEQQQVREAWSQVGIDV